MSTHKLGPEEFLRISDQFRLGKLPTEGFHPKTNNLSYLANHNLKDGLEVLKQVDADALKCVENKFDLITKLSKDIHETFLKGNKVFLCGCGATGRLSIALETLYRQATNASNVISFMAGGDVALIKSIESFEDKVSFGARQLLELGFKQGDLLISCTEGGETPFVIGATEEATKYSNNNPYFLFCNPAEILGPLVERSENVLLNERINKIELSTGPMALSGSTRMQASTVLMLAVGVALLGHGKEQELLLDDFGQIKEFLIDLDYRFLEPFIEKEASLYKEGKFINYETQSHLGISVLTDTTERSPTFSLIPFENDLDEKIHPSLCYLSLVDTKSSAAAWKAMLGRRPRVLDWIEFEGGIGLERIYGFDISSKAKRLRKDRVGTEVSTFSIYEKDQIIHCELEGIKGYFKFPENVLALHLGIKVLFNAHSTLVMGRLGRYQDNMMSWVKPSNYKLIDRAARYIQKILSNRNIDESYENIIYKIFETKINEGESIIEKVLLTYDSEPS
jgi:N-acetylmuramic acid 6-phosphate etherase